MLQRERELAEINEGSSDLSVGGPAQFKAINLLLSEHQQDWKQKHVCPAWFTLSDCLNTPAERRVLRKAQSHFDGCRLTGLQVFA